ncbi:ubiquinone biosynthesis [Fusarium globosum]|uniref:Ubiquinone biosynthesis n=1 Tax=Fusarium globosum TaxID=78864 RepID=A0A8H5XHQ2_9HYPO|nr:ubiquinone biosynthesis [Fusarium globosum]
MSRVVAHSSHQIRVNQAGELGAVLIYAAQTPIVVLATGLGWATAIMGKEAAMACTEAVETEIGTHYNEQVEEVIKIIQGWEQEGYEAGTEILEFLQTLRRIRDEELQHLDHAVEHDAKNAPLHDLLIAFVRTSCRGAIFVSQRV